MEDEIDQLTKNAGRKTQPLLFLVFVLCNVFCIQVPVVDPINNTSFAFVPPIHYLLGREGCFVDKLHQDVLEIVVAFIKDAVDCSSPTTSSWCQWLTLTQRQCTHISVIFSPTENEVALMGVRGMIHIIGIFNCTAGGYRKVVVCTGSSL